MASASGGLLFINGVGAMGGPIVVGYLMTIHGPSAFFGYIGLLMALIGGYGIYRMTQRASTTVDDMAPYLPISNRTTQVAVEIAIEAVEDADEQSDTSR